MRQCVDGETDVPPVQAASRTAEEQDLRRFPRRKLRDCSVRQVRGRAFLTGGIDRSNEIAVSLAAAHLVVGVGGRDYVRHLLKRAMRFAAIYVIARHGGARLRHRRIPLQNYIVGLLIVGLLIGCDPEEHHADDSGKHDRQDRNRPE